MDTVPDCGLSPCGALWFVHLDDFRDHPLPGQTAPKMRGTVDAARRWASVTRARPLSVPLRRKTAMPPRWSPATFARTNDASNTHTGWRPTWLYIIVYGT